MAELGLFWAANLVLVDEGGGGGGGVVSTCHHVDHVSA